MTRQGIMPTIERLRTDLEKYPTNILKNAGNVAKAILAERERQDHLGTFQKAKDAYRKRRTSNNLFFLLILTNELDDIQTSRRLLENLHLALSSSIIKELASMYEDWFRGKIVLTRNQVDYVNKYNLLGKLSHKIQEKLGYDEFDIYQGKFVRASLS